MAYSKHCSELFSSTTYYRNGRAFAIKRHNGTIHFINKPYSAPVEITRAQAYKYWERHFPGRCCYSLPEILQKALEKPCVSHGFFVNHLGEAIGYSG